MKSILKSTLLLLAAAGLCRTPAAFCSESPTSFAGRFYFTAHGGVSWMEDVSARGDSLYGKVRFDPGARLDVAGGYLLTPSLGVEIELGLVVNHLRTFNSLVFDDDSVYLLQIPMLANLQWRIPTRSRLKPFIGAGIGSVYTELQDWAWFSDGTGGHDFTLGFQGVAGLRYEINSRMEMGAAYKFTGTTDHQIDHMDGTRSHSVLFSFSMKF